MIELPNRSIAVYGSTGSVGKQTLDVARYLKVKVNALSASTDVDLIETQAREFKPILCVMNNEKAASELKFRLSDTNIKVYGGSLSMEETAYSVKADLFFNSIMGIAGLRPTLAAIKSHKNIALANKETLVTAGDLVMSEAKSNKVSIIPVDSEHSAIFQCLSGSEVSRILLTCSGGPFFGYSHERLKNLTPEEALAHPTWKMGAKISIDSATLMNKGLEVIEAVRLFGVSPEKIEVIIHRESIIHSMVEYIDNTVIAQMSVPDMRMCIQFAMTYPERFPSQSESLDLIKLSSLSFYKPDIDTFTLLPLAYRAIKAGGIVPARLNGANEKAVELFLKNKITFSEIFDVVTEVVNNSTKMANPTVNDIEAADIEARADVDKLLLQEMC